MEFSSFGDHQTEANVPPSRSLQISCVSRALSKVLNAQPAAAGLSQAGGATGADMYVDI